MLHKNLMVRQFPATGLLVIRVFVVLSLLASTAAEARQVKPVASSPSGSLGRYVPVDNLLFYAEFEGLDRHATTWKKSAYFKLLNETKLGELLEDLAVQGIEKALATAPRQGRPTPAGLLGVFKAALKDGFVFALAKPDPGRDPSAVFVLRNARKNGFVEFFRSIDVRTPAQRKVERVGSRTIDVEESVINQTKHWYEGEDWVLTIYPPVDAYATLVMASIDGKTANALTHPIRANLARPETGFEPVGYAFFDLSKLPNSAQNTSMGLDSVKHIDYRWGFQDDALYSILRVSIPGPRRGLIAMFEAAFGSTFDKTTLPPIPTNISGWTVFSFSPGSLWRAMIEYFRVEAAKAGMPVDQLGIVKFDRAATNGIKARLQEDFLDKLGPRWFFYYELDFLNPGNAARGALLADIRDSSALEPTLDRVIMLLYAYLQSQARINPRVPLIGRLGENSRGYKLVFPPGALPAQYAKIVAPTLLLGRTQLAIGLNEAEARAALAAKAWTPGPDYAATFAKIPGNLIALSVKDPRISMPEMIAMLPETLPQLNALAAGPNAQSPFAFKIDRSKIPPAAELRRRLFPGMMAVSLDREGLKIVTRESAPSMISPSTSAVAAALLLPAVQAAREAARRTQCANNLKQIGLALHNYQANNNGFPSAAIVGKDGKPLLSWRVAILPYIEEQELYNEFHLNEPWDSPHNKALIPRMPRTYVCPSRPPTEPGVTTYLALVGNGALFEPNKPVSSNQVTDGTANTLAVVESTQAVLWTKPADIDFSPRLTIAALRLGSNHPGVYNALFADGSVKFLKSSLNAVTLRAMITRQGGEVIQNAP